MKTITIKRAVPRLVLGVTILASSGVGVYALANWFGGDVAVTQDSSSTLSIDLSSCKGNLPAGVEQTDDRKNIQFKITGNPHISAQDLQQNLLGGCEYSAVVDFYKTKFPDAGFHRGDDFSEPTNQQASAKYLLLPAVVRSVDGNTITLSFTVGKGQPHDQTLTLAPNATVYSQAQASTLASVHAGDTVTFVAYSAGTTSTPIEGTSIFDRSDTKVVSVFKTQYDDTTAFSFDYSKSNVMPMDAYNQQPASQSN